MIKQLIDPKAAAEYVEAQYPGDPMLQWIGKSLVHQFPTVEAVELEKYDDLREAFIDYVCSGVPNPAPYCGNRCRECVDGRGWCKEDPATCKGFNPDGEVKDVHGPAHIYIDDEKTESGLLEED